MLVRLKQLLKCRNKRAFIRELYLTRAKNTNVDSDVVKAKRRKILPWSKRMYYPNKPYTSTQVLVSDEPTKL